MILGLGIDVVEIDRLRRLWERHGAAFVARICQPGECQPRSSGAMPTHLAGLFAAKEAVLKALGTGWAEGLGFAQVEVTRQPGGAPGVRLHAAAAERARALGVTAIHLSITHEHAYAAAVAVLEGERRTAADPC